MPLSKIDILFGLPKIDASLIFNINVLIIYGKWYIYRCKIDNKSMFFLEFLNYFKQFLLAEKYILASKGESDLFQQRWQILFNALF